LLIFVFAVVWSPKKNFGIQLLVKRANIFRVSCKMLGETALTVICHFCFNEIDVDLEIDQSFEGSNTEIYDCTICCNPNKLQYTVNHGSVINVLVSDGNE